EGGDSCRTNGRVLVHQFINGGRTEKEQRGNRQSDEGALPERFVPRLLRATWVPSAERLSHHRRGRETERIGRQVRNRFDSHADNMRGEQGAFHLPTGETPDDE